MTWKKKTKSCLANHLLAFWRRPHVSDLMFQFSLLKCFPQQRKFANWPTVYKSWDISGSKGGAARGKEGVPYHMLELVHSHPRQLCEPNLILQVILLGQEGSFLTKPENHALRKEKTRENSESEQNNISLKWRIDTSHLHCSAVL